jgi:hypothetical protein
MEEGTHHPHSSHDTEAKETIGHDKTLAFVNPDRLVQ